jgi:RecB family exonuclease
VQDRYMTTIELPPHPADLPAQPAEPTPSRSMGDAPLSAYESHSSISTYLACPLRYGFRYVERRPGEVSPGQFAFGNAVHRSFEAFGRARIAAVSGYAPEPGRETLQGAFDHTIAGCGLAPEEVAAAKRRFAPVLDRFLRREAVAGGRPLGVELGFDVDVPLPREATDGTVAIRFVGYIDRVDRASDGSTVIVDYKTGRLRTQADVDADPQLTAYAFGCARGGLRDPATREVLRPASRLGLYFAEAGELTWTARSDDQLASFEDRLVETVGRIHARGFAARPAPWRCRWCEFRNECPQASPEA